MPPEFSRFVPLADSVAPPTLRGHSFTLRDGLVPTGGKLDRTNPPPYVLRMQEAHVSPVEFLLHESFHHWQLGAFEDAAWCLPQHYSDSRALSASSVEGVVKEASHLIVEQAQERLAWLASRPAAESTCS